MDISDSNNVMGPVRCSWFFSEEDLRRSPSVIAGMAHSDEQHELRKGCAFIRRMAERLNDTQKDMTKLTHLCISVSMIQLRRFFAVQSLQTFDVMDTAAAILFMTSKSEECPRRLEMFVRTWYKIRHEFDTKGSAANELLTINKETYQKFSDYISWLENIVLQTVGFNLTIELPHVFVISLLQQFKADDKNFKEALFWFVTDTLHLTNWSLRYDPSKIACVCYYLVSLWRDEKDDLKSLNGNSWMSEIDKFVTLEFLQEMSKEFVTIWKDVDREFHLATSQFDHKAVVPTILTHHMHANRNYS